MSYQSKLKATLQAAKDHAAQHLVECAVEVVEWQDTGILKPGRVREVAAMIEPVSETSHGALASAEMFVERAALEAVIRSAAVPDDAEVDVRIDAVLRASGSALHHYSMAKTREDMRVAMRAAMMRI